MSHIKCTTFTTLALSLILVTGVSAQTSVSPSIKPPVLSLPDQPPVLSTPGYEVDSSKPLFQTAVEVEDLACGKTHLCNSSVGQNGRNRCFSCSFKCQCDEKCHIYGDCCADVTFQRTENRLSTQPSDFKCLDRFPKRNTDVASEYVFMVGICPSASTVPRDTVFKCEHPNVTDYQQATPVTDLSTNITYRNMFCAQCFGVEIYETWIYNIECQVGSLAENATSKDELWKFLLDDQKCVVTNSPPNRDVGVLRKCVQQTVNKCNVTGRWEIYNRATEELCNSYYHPVKSIENGGTFKNVFCAMCNGVVVNRNRQCFPTFNIVPRRGKFFPFSKPLSVLIDFNAEVVEKPETTPPETIPVGFCLEQEIFDPITESCHRLDCSPRRILTDGVCKPVYKSGQGLGYTFSLVIEPSHTVNGSLVQTFIETYEQNLLKSLERFQPFALTSIDYVSFSKRAETDEKELSRVEVTGNMVSKADISIFEVEHGLKNLGQTITEVSLVENVEIVLSQRLLSCPGSNEDALDEIPVPDWSIKTISAQSFLNCFDELCLNGVKYLPLYGILDCPHITMNTSEHNFTYNPENTTLSVFGQNILLNESSHYFCRETLKLCASVVYDIQEIWRSLNDSNNDSIPPPISTSDLAMTILSIVCIALSLTCLFLTFVVYCVLRSLRTLPGKNTMALIFHLFCAQLIFQVGIQLNFDGTLCRAMGVLIHYLWLTAFAWMAISAYHMCAVFSNMAASRFSSHSADQKRLLRYIAVANLFALIFVLSCVITHLAKSKGSEIGYGHNICFINRPMDIGIFFALPVGLVLVFNATCFVKTVVSIRKVPDMKNSKNKPNRNHMHVYFRLSILLGFTWIFGFVAAVFRTDVLWYIFIILNGLQGVFIFVAYCLNKRTVKQLQNKFRIHGRIKYSRPSKTSSSERTTHSTSV